MSNEYYSCTEVWLYSKELTPVTFNHSPLTKRAQDKVIKNHTGAPTLTTGLYPNKSIINWKYCKPKIHLIHLTCWTSELSLAYLTYAQNTISKKMLTAQHTVKYGLFSLVITWLTGSCGSAPHHERGSYRALTASPGNDQNSNHGFYQMHYRSHTTIKSTICKLNHRYVTDHLYTNINL